MAEPAFLPEQMTTAAPSLPPMGKLPTRAERIRDAMGKFAWIPFSSDDHIREKQGERDIEKRQQEER